MLKKFFNDNLNSIPWDVIKVFDNVNDTLDAWYSLLSEAIDKHVIFCLAKVLKERCRGRVVRASRLRCRKSP